MKPATLLLIFLSSVLVGCGGNEDVEFPDQEAACQFDEQRELSRSLSANSFPNPVITSMKVNGNTIWHLGDSTLPTLRPGDDVVLVGSGLGYGPDIDFSKIMVGNVRVLETDLKMYKQEINIFKQIHFEVPQLQDTWDKDVLNWEDDMINFRVPVHANNGPIVVQVQKRIDYNESLLRPGEAHNVIDAQNERITDKNFVHNCDVVSRLGPTKKTVAVPVNIVNADYQALVDLGEAMYWSYEYNLGLSHSARNLDWVKIFTGKATDPITGEIADPFKLFGAYPTVRGEVPDVAIDDYFFDPYPQKTPIPGFLTLSPQLTKGNTRNSGFVGYRFAESSHPFLGVGEWIGFNCASCHGYRISYEKSPGVNITRVFGGLPNPHWSMKWTLLDTFSGVKGTEPGPTWSPGEASVDKTSLIYNVYAGTGDPTMVRGAGEGSLTDNDYSFSPVATPDITQYLPIRRSISHTESYVGFEGSYIHAQEPNGATGSMFARPLQALTAYMTVLDEYNGDLINVGLYRWLRHNGLLQTAAGNVSEGEFVQAGWQAYGGVKAAVDRGKAIFQRDCGSCHADDLMMHTNEDMFRLDEVGRFFAFTDYQRKMQSIRVGFLHNMYWVQHRGLLSDGHVRNLEDLVNPDRCREGSDLYNNYYTIHEPSPLGNPGADFPTAFPPHNQRGDVFRVYKSAGTDGAARNRFVERHKYFVEVPWDTEFYYWDYQKFRAEYGVAELGSDEPIGLPAAPHPWCTQNKQDISDLMHYILTL